MTTLGSSRFRDIFVLSLSSSNEQIRCAMSQPWLRIAFIQAVKQRRSPSDMITLLQSLLHLPEKTHPCSKKEPSTRNWYRLIDPFDDTIVPGFEICAHCVRNVDLVFPCLRGIFKRTTSLIQERVCNLNTQSKRFLGYIEQFDKASSHFTFNSWMQKPDTQMIARYARRVANIQDCRRDTMLFSTEWHFMHSLPEFTICRECFEEVVRPLWDRQVANAFPKSARLLPSTSMARDTKYVPAGATSCQLYSPRMRKVFTDAVMNNDFETLRDEAVKRHNAELQCQAKHKELQQTQELSANERYARMKENAQVWQTWQ